MVAYIQTGSSGDNYVYQESLPPLSAMTMCFWLQSDNFDDKHAVLSIANNGTGSAWGLSYLFVYYVILYKLLFIHDLSPTLPLLLLPPPP